MKQMYNLNSRGYVISILTIYQIEFAMQKREKNKTTKKLKHNN